MLFTDSLFPHDINTPHSALGEISSIFANLYVPIQTRENIIRLLTFVVTLSIHNSIAICKYNIFTLYLYTLFLLVMLLNGFHENINSLTGFHINSLFTGLIKINLSFFIGLPTNPITLPFLNLNAFTAKKLLL